LASSEEHSLARQFAQRLHRDALLRERSGNAELALAEPLAAAIMSFCRGDYDSAVDSISAIRSAADRCGGSIAQCDLIHLTLLESALRGRRKPLARTLAAERAERKPASRLNRWLKAAGLGAWGRGDGGVASQYPRFAAANSRQAAMPSNKFHFRCPTLVQWLSLSVSGEAAVKTIRVAFGVGLLALLLAPRAMRASRASSSTRRFLSRRQPGSAAPPIAYEQIAGRAFGELDPKLPMNAIIQDIELAKDPDGKVRYVASFVIYKPVDMSKASGLMLARGAQSRPRVPVAAQEQAFGDIDLSSAWQGDNAAPPR
jgi:hypothetical protein